MARCIILSGMLSKARNTAEPRKTNPHGMRFKDLCQLPSLNLYYMLSAETGYQEANDRTRTKADVVLTE